MSVSSRYRGAWEGFWSEAPGGQGGVLWDAEPALTAAVHLAHFEPYLTAPDLPLVDLGCGNGTQTRFLSDRFPQVVGTDLVSAALDHARAADPAGRARYRLLDAADKAETEALHAELGDANVYMRGVLHQSEPDDRQPLTDGLATLAGDRGRVFGRAGPGRRSDPARPGAEPRRPSGQAGPGVPARHRPGRGRGRRGPRVPAPGRPHRPRER